MRINGITFSIVLVFIAFGIVLLDRVEYSKIPTAPVFRLLKINRGYIIRLCLVAWDWSFGYCWEWQYTSSSVPFDTGYADLSD